MLPVALYPLERLPGPAAMAADERLLQRAACGAAGLRFYTWPAPTASIGYFQPAAVREGRFAALPWVRRSTGGAMLVHHHELTYAFALPAGRDWQPAGPGAESWLCRAHHAIRDALAEFGAATRSVVCGEEQKLGDGLCFLHQTPGDLLAAGAKVVGSAQRKSHGALLQHGGILLRRSEFTPELLGVMDLTGVAIAAEALAVRLKVRFARDFGWDLVETAWTAEDEAARGEIERDKYGAAAWAAKR